MAITFEIKISKFFKSAIVLMRILLKPAQIRQFLEFPDWTFLKTPKDNRKKLLHQNTSLYLILKFLHVRSLINFSNLSKNV
jgi:hypothetical protein